MKTEVPVKLHDQKMQQRYQFDCFQSIKKNRQRQVKVKIKMTDEVEWFFQNVTWSKNS